MSKIHFKTKESFLEQIQSHAIDLTEEAKGKVTIKLLDNDSLIYIFSIPIFLKNGQLFYHHSSKKVTFTKKYSLTKLELYLNAHLVGTATINSKIEPNDSLTWTTIEGQPFVHD